MGFLALAALCAGVAPLLFSLPAGLARAIAVAEWAIIALFAVEYAVHLALARDRRRYVLNPWRILDAIIILAPLVSLLPFAPEWARSSPALRVLRLVRVILFGARARRGLAVTEEKEIAGAPSGPPRVSVLASGDAAPRESSWTELVRWIVAPSTAWMHAANLDAARIKEIAAIVDLP